MDKIRDTDADWQKIAATQPFWGVLTHPQYRMENLSEEKRTEFYDSGVSHIGRVRKDLEKLGVKFPVARAVDFGCGVGRLAIPMARLADTVTGIDVADDMLRIAAAEARLRGVANLNLVRALTDERFTWVNSHIVLQHIPPARGLAIIEDLLGRLDPGGAVSMQIFFSRGRDGLISYIREGEDWRYDGAEIRRVGTAKAPPVGTPQVFDYDLNAVVNLFLQRGFDWINMKKYQSTRHLGVIIYAVLPR